MNWHKSYQDWCVLFRSVYNWIGTEWNSRDTPMATICFLGQGRLTGRVPKSAIPNRWNEGVETDPVSPLHGLNYAHFHTFRCTTLRRESLFRKRLDYLKSLHLILGYTFRPHFVWVRVRVRAWVRFRRTTFLSKCRTSIPFITAAVGTGNTMTRFSSSERLLRNFLGVSPC